MEEYAYASCGRLQGCGWVGEESEEWKLAKWKWKGGNRNNQHPAALSDNRFRRYNRSLPAEVTAGWSCITTEKEWQNGRTRRQKADTRQARCTHCPLVTLGGVTKMTMFKRES